MSTLSCFRAGAVNDQTAHPAAGRRVRWPAGGDAALATEDADDLLGQMARCSDLACAAWSEDAGTAVPEIGLLRDLWRLADPSERRVLATAMARAFARDDEWW